MSRHSKNSNSSTIFTYAQRQKLKNQYGTIQTRLGQDSMKKFQMCSLCANIMTQPTSCDKGHLFCRSCIIEYLVKQKKVTAMQGQQKKKQKQKEAERQKQRQLQEKVKKIQQFERYDSFTQITGRNKIIINGNNQKGQLFNSNINQQKVTSKDVKPIGIYQINSTKDKYVKTSFWAVQNTPQLQDKSKKEESNKIKCPGSKIQGHHISLKKLRKIECKIVQGVYMCWICSKQINKQRIGVYKCGHLVCFNCKSNQCEMCSCKDGWLEVERSYTSFSEHNKSQVKTYTHAFMC